MTGDQILQTAGAVSTGVIVYFLAQIALHLLAQPPQPKNTEKEAGKK